MTANLFRDELQDEIDFSVELLKRNEPAEGYHGCFSGGKDSCVIKELARMAGVKVSWHYNVTTIDPPELVRFIRRYHKDVIFELPPEPFWKMAQRRGFPTRRIRWCCEEYKEKSSPMGAVMIMGVRSSEGQRRKAQWSEVTFHRHTKAVVVSPILSWSNENVWNFIRQNGLSYCSLYDEGFKRLGCVGCPMAGKQRLEQFIRWPHYERLWKRLFQQIWDRRTGLLQRDGRIWFGNRHFSTWEEMWDWWLNDRPLKDEKCQGLIDKMS